MAAHFRSFEGRGRFCFVYISYLDIESIKENFDVFEIIFLSDNHDTILRQYSKTIPRADSPWGKLIDLLAVM